MEGTDHEKTFMYRYKIIVVNLLLMATIVGLDPVLLQRIPESEAMNYYLGVIVFFALFLEFAGIHYKSLVIFASSLSLYRKAPFLFTVSFIPRVVFSGVVATLAVETMGGLKFTEFFLIPIVLYAAGKEFWVRKTLFSTERERGPRPNHVRTALADIFLFLFIVIAYSTAWKIYLLDSPHIMFMVMSPINWAFSALVFGLILYSFEMPLFWEDYLKPKTKLQKRLSYLSLLLPVFGLLARFYLQAFT
jgi:hypothetical protein